MENIKLLSGLLIIISVFEIATVLISVYAIIRNTNAMKSNVRKFTKVIGVFHIVIGLALVLIKAISGVMGVEFSLSLICIGISMLHMAIGMLMVVYMISEETGCRIRL